MDTSLALRQSVALLLTMPAAIGVVSYLFGDTVIFGVLSGLLMAVVILLSYWWSDVLGNPEHAGWFSDR
ncbi:hypothetical protein [Halalkalicoccus subterraneus]|uniref:hypothetical protein n=1 Tax=Halalkalicoccus subterraneus TaxID=2675002 RepID=UPI0013CE8180